MYRIAAISFVLVTLVAQIGFAQPDRTAPETPAREVEAPENTSLVVMSFNIRYGTANDKENAWPKRRQLVIDRIIAANANVVGLQEALKFQIDELIAALPEYAFTGVGRDDGLSGGEHCAILYRRANLRIEPSQPPAKGSPPSHGSFWYSETPGIPGSKSWGNNITRICTWARFERAGEKEAFYIFNTHFDHESQPSREKSAQLLKQSIAQRGGTDPVIVTGDFNAGEKNAAIVTMLSVEPTPGINGRICPPLRDTFRVVHPNDREVGTFNSFRGVTTGDKIDYIFVDEHWEVLRASIDRTMPDGRCPSDHFPVVATLRLKHDSPESSKP